MLKKILNTFLFLSISFLAFSQKDTLIVGYTVGPPFVLEKEQKLNGISVWLWEQLASELHLQFEYKKMPFSDLLKSLENGKIDVAINALTVTSQRSHLFDFSYPFYISNSTVVVKKRSLFKKIKSFFNPILTIEFLSGFLLLGFIIFLFGFILWLIERRKNKAHFRPGWKGIWDGIWWSMVTMTTVGYGDKTPQSTMGKMMALMWMFIALLFVSGLTASLTSSFTMTRISQSTANLADFKSKKLGTVANSGSFTFLKQRFFKDIHTFTNLKEGLNALAKNEIEGFIYDEPILKYRIDESAEYNFCEVLPVRFDQQNYSFGFAVGQDSLLKEVSLEIIKITETLDWQILLSEYDLSEF